MDLVKILSIINIVLFFGVMLFSKSDKNKTYVKYILLTYPFININIVPSLLNGFQIITILYFFGFYKWKSYNFIEGIIYKYMIILLIIILSIGAILCDLGPGADTLSDYISVFPIFMFTKIIISECIEDEKFFYKIIFYLKITLFVSFIFLAIQFVVGVKFTLSRTMNPNITNAFGFRYPSFLSDPQHYSQYLASLCILCFIKDPEEKKQSFFNVVLLVLGVISLMATGGRAGLMGLLLGFGIIILFTSTKVKIGIISSGLLLYVMLLNFASNLAIFNRGTDMEDTYAFRNSIWADAFKMFTDSPFIGIGIGNYARYVTIHNPNQVWLINFHLVPFNVPESGYLKILSEMGGPAFIIIMSLLLFPMINGFIMFIKKKDFNLILLISAILSFLVGFYATYSIGDSRMVVLFSIMPALLIYYHYNLKSKEKEEKEALAENEELLVQNPDYND